MNCLIFLTSVVRPLDNRHGFYNGGTTVKIIPYSLEECGYQETCRKLRTVFQTKVIESNSLDLNTI